MTAARFTSFQRKILPALLTSLVLVACSSNKDPQQNITKAKQHLEQKNVPAAVIELKNALQQNADLGEARYLLGKTYLDVGDAKAAEIELRKALALNYDNDKTIPVLAMSVLNQNQPDKVLKEFENRKLVSTEAQVQLLTVIGSADLRNAKLDEAAAIFAKALTMQPNDADAMLGEARVLGARNDYAAAEARVENVLSQTPKRVSALLLKGDLQQIQRHYDLALAAYNQAASEEPNNFNAHFSLANTYMAMGQLDAVKVQSGLLKKIAPRHPVIGYFDALVAYSEKQFKPAQEAMQKSLASAPDNPQSLLLAGSIELALGQLAQAEQHLRGVLTQMPANLFARKQLAKLYMQEKQPLKATEVLQAALEADTQDPEVLTLAGNAALGTGEFDKASIYFNQATQLVPKNATILTQSAIAQFAQGNNERAYAQLDSASQSDPKNTRPDLMRIVAHMRRNEFDEALKQWQVLEQKQPDSPITYNLQATLLLGKKDEAGARKAFEHALALDPVNFPATTNLARLDLNDNNVEAAKQRFRNVLSKDPNHLLALLGLASLEQTAGQTTGGREAALTLINKARQAHPEAIQPIEALVKYYVYYGDTQQALATLTQALATDPKNPLLLNAMGTLQLSAGDKDQAIDTFRKIVNDNPDQAPYLMRLAEAQVAAGKIEAAKLSMNKALQLRPDALDIQVNAVSLLMQAGKLDDAQKMLNQIQASTPKSPNLAHLQGDIQMAGHHYDAAAASYKKAFASAPTNGLLIKTHQAMSNAGSKAAADDLLNAWLKAHPTDIVVQTYAAESKLNAGDYAKALAQYKLVAAQQPNDFKVLNNMAFAAQELKDPKALEYAQKAYALSASSPTVGDTLGWIMVEQGQVKPGIELLQSALKKIPQHPGIELHLAKALLKDGQKDAARQHLQAIAKAVPNSAPGKEATQMLGTL